MTGCSAPNCTNNSQKGFKLFHFPSDEERRLQWTQNCRRLPGWSPSRYSCICEVHFEQSQFELHRADGLKKLRPYAVPTIFDKPKNSRNSKKKLKKSADDNTVHEPDEKVKMEVLKHSRTGRLIRSSNRQTDAGEWTPEAEVSRARKRGRPLGSANRNKSVAVSPVRKSARLVGQRKRKWAYYGSDDEDDDGKDGDVVPKVLPKKEKGKNKGRCFVCNNSMLMGTPLVSLTPSTKISMQEKLSKLLVGEAGPVIEKEGALCSLCTRLLNYMDKIEVEYDMLSKAFVKCLRKKHALNLKEGEDQATLSLQVQQELSGEANRLKCSNDSGKKVSHAGVKAFCRHAERQSMSWEETDEGNSKALASPCDDADVDDPHPVEAVPDITEGSSSEDQVLQRSEEAGVEKSCPVHQFRCQICQYKTSYKSVIIFHLRQHIKESFRCDFCNETLRKAPKSLFSAYKCCKRRKEMPVSSTGKSHTEVRPNNVDDANGLQVESSINSAVDGDPGMGVPTNRIDFAFEAEVPTINQNCALAFETEVPTINVHDESQVESPMNSANNIIASETEVPTINAHNESEAEVPAISAHDESQTKSTTKYKDNIVASESEAQTINAHDNSEAELSTNYADSAVAFEIGVSTIHAESRAELLTPSVTNTVAFEASTVSAHDDSEVELLTTCLVSFETEVPTINVHDESQVESPTHSANNIIASETEVPSINVHNESEAEVPAINAHDDSEAELSTNCADSAIDFETEIPTFSLHDESQAESPTHSANNTVASEAEVPTINAHNVSKAEVPSISTHIEPRAELPTHSSNNIASETEDPTFNAHNESEAEVPTIHAHDDSEAELSKNCADSAIAFETKVPTINIHDESQPESPTHSANNTVASEAEVPTIDAHNESEAEVPAISVHDGSRAESPTHSANNNVASETEVPTIDAHNESEAEVTAINAHESQTKSTTNSASEAKIPTIYACIVYSDAKIPTNSIDLAGDSDVEISTSSSADLAGDSKEVVPTIHVNVNYEVEISNNSADNTIASEAEVPTIYAHVVYSDAEVPTDHADLAVAFVNAKTNKCDEIVNLTLPHSSSDTALAVNSQAKNEFALKEDNSSTRAIECPIQEDNASNVSDEEVVIEVEVPSEGNIEMVFNNTNEQSVVEDLNTTGPVRQNYAREEVLALVEEWD